MTFNGTSRYKDRIESSGTSNLNPYRQDPWAMKAYQAKQMQAKDRIETSQERLERELMDKFRKNNYQLPKGSFLLMAHVGKAVMLFLFLPPYYLGYLMPIWIFQKLSLPAEKAMEVVKVVVESLMLRVSAWSNILYQTLAKKIAPLFKRKKVKDKGPNLFQELGQRIQDKVKESIKVLKLAESYKQIRSFVSDQRIQWSSWVIQSTQRLYKSSKHKLQTLYRSLKIASLGFINRQSVKITQRFMVLAKPFIVAGQFVDRSIEKMVKRVSKAVEISYRKVADLLWPLKPVVTTIATILVIPAAQLSRFAEAASQALSKRLEKSSETMKSVVQRVSNEISKQVTAFVARTAALFAPAGQAVKGMVLYRLQQANKRLDVIKKALHRLVRSVLDKGKEHAKKAQVLLKQLGKKIKKVSFQAAVILSKTPLYLWGFLKGAFRIFISFCKVYWKAMRLLYAWTKVLTRYSFEKIVTSINS